MNFSEFVNIMYEFIGCELKKADYVVWIISLIMGQPQDEEDEIADDNGKFNPIAELNADTLRKIFRGQREISANNATAILRHMDDSAFMDKINDLDIGKKELLVEKLRTYNFEVSVNNVDVVCTDIFTNLIEALAEGKKNVQPGLLKKRNAKGKIIHEVPLATAYLDNGKLYIGGDFIELPDSLNYKDSTSMEEQPYIKAICEAFSDALKRPVSLDNIESLPKRYRVSFNDHRNYYNNATWLEHSLRDVYSEFDNQFEILKEDAYEGIKETYYREDYNNGNERLNEVMIKITNTSLDKSALTKILNLIGNKEKKGICHILVNDGTIVSWVDIDAE